MFLVELRKLVGRPRTWVTIALLADFVHGSVRGEVNQTQAQQDTGMTELEWWEKVQPLLVKVYDAERFPTRETDRPQPVSPYGVTKLAAEHLCELYRGGFGVPTASPVCPTPPITSPAATRWPTCRWFVLPSVRCA